MKINLKKIYKKKTTEQTTSLHWSSNLKSRRFLPNNRHLIRNNNNNKPKNPKNPKKNHKLPQQPNPDNNPNKAYKKSRNSGRRQKHIILGHTLTKANKKFLRPFFKNKQTQI